MIQFHLLFEVADERCAEFEKAYAAAFLPALRKQAGFVTSKLLRRYPEPRMREIQAAPSEFNYEVHFVFESEDARRRWAVSGDHDVAWPAVSGIARKVGWRGYDIVESSDAFDPVQR